jgi:hypothetical protein
LALGDSRAAVGDRDEPSRRSQAARDADLQDQHGARLRVARLRVARLRVARLGVGEARR